MSMEHVEGTTRRSFLAGAATAVGAMGTAGLVANIAAGTAAHAAEVSSPEDAAAVSDTVINKVANQSSDTTYVPRPNEYPTVPMPAPEQTAYACDVLVVGGGLAGLNAAYAAAQAGMSVVLADKGTPGYSGLSAWPSCNAYYDPELDVDRATWDQYMIYSCDSFANLDWEDVWLDESKATYERLKQWGWITSYEKPGESPKTYENGENAGYWVNGYMFDDDAKGYFQNVVGDLDRRKVFMRVLEENGVTVADHVMVTDIVESDGVCKGAVGVHFKSGTFVTFAAKSVVLCTGAGTVKSTGFPLGADTFDGLWMGYQHGLPITGLEFEDTHGTNSVGAGNVFMWSGWQYVEPVWPTGGTVDQAALDAFATPAKGGKWNACVSAVKTGYAIPDITSLSGDSGAACSAAYAAGNEADERIGKWTSRQPRTDRPGGACGFPSHLTSGVWCGLDNTTGETAITGLYVAGDGTNASYVGGPNYGCQRGSTSNFVSIMGFRAGTVAAERAATVETPELPADIVAALEEEALAPMRLEKGFDPSWVRDKLQDIVSQPWVLYTKTQESLTAALSTIQSLRSMVHGKLIAKNPHELRLAHEVEHQLDVMVLKMHASLGREESRGNHYRADHPFKDDENMLCYLTFTKGADGEPVMEKVPLKERWVGDLSAPYEKRYPILETPEEVELYTPAK